MTASPDYIRGQRDGMERAAGIVIQYATERLDFSASLAAMQFEIVAAAIRAAVANLPEAEGVCDADDRLEKLLRELEGSLSERGEAFAGTAIENARSALLTFIAGVEARATAAEAALNQTGEA